MAWLYQRPDSKKWWIGFRKNGRQFLLSTKTTDKREAEKKLHDYELIERHESDGRSNDLIIEVLTGKKPNAITLSAAANDYLTEAKGAGHARTLQRDPWRVP